MEKKLGNSEIKSIAARGLSAARAYDSSNLSDNRKRALDYFSGKLDDTPSKKNRSSAVSNDVSDTIGWILPGVMRVFTASDIMGEYEPAGEGDEESSKQSTDYINHVFWNECSGYQVIWDSIHDALLLQNGVIKHYWDDSEQSEVSTHSGLSLMAANKLIQEEGVEVLAATISDDVEFEETVDLKIKRVLSHGRLIVEAIPPEDFLIDEQSKFIDEDETSFCAHSREITRSELVKMKFKKADIAKIPRYSSGDSSEIDDARGNETTGEEDAADVSMETVELQECYFKADVDGDGEAETIKAYLAGGSENGVLLDWEIWDKDLPFTDIVSDRVPHRRRGKSIADETMDIMQIKTVLLRGGLDNTYAANNPQKEVEAGSVVNTDQLTNPNYGGTIWKKKGTAPILPHVTPYTADRTFAAFEQMNAIIEQRTGVSRASMALDPDALQNQTAEAVRTSKDSSYSKIELIARHLAEMGFKRLFKMMLRIIVKNQDRARTIRLRDKWVEMDPRHWNASMDVVINVGMGTGSRDRDLAVLESVLQKQFLMVERFMAAGLPDLALELLPKISTTLAKIAESAGLKNPDQFYPEIGEDKLEALRQRLEQGGEQQDPKIAMEQQRLMMDREKMMLDAQLRREEAQADIEMKRAQLAQEISLKREQLVAEMQLKRELAMAGYGSSGPGSGVHLGGMPG